MKQKTTKPLERDVQRQCADYLRLLGCLVIRVNSGAMVGEYAGKKRFLRFNDQPGCSDLLAVMPDGIFAAIEVKRPGGKATEKQLAFLSEVTRRGGLGLVVDSLDSLRDALAAEGYGS